MTDSIPTYTGDETYEDKMKKWENERRAFISDLQSEREKRHAVEERLERVEASLTAAGSDSGESVQDKVQRLSNDPDSYIEEVITPRLESIEKTIIQDRHERKIEKAYSWLAKQEKTDVDDIYGSEIEKEIVRISKDHGLGSMDPINGTRAAYKIYQQERREQKEREEKRDATISSHSTETGRPPVRAGNSRYTAESIRQLIRDGKYDEHRDAILKAQAEGQISQ